MIAANYPFLDVMWTMLVFFCWILWFWLLFAVFGDVFRRHDLSGLAKTAWVVFMIVLPFLGVFVYMITQNDGMTERNLERARQQKAQFDGYVREAAGTESPATQIEKAKQLLDTGTITPAEFATIKDKALTTA